MADPFAGMVGNGTQPATRHFEITPSDDNDLTPQPRVLRVLTEGNLAIQDFGGVEITYAVTAGEVFMFAPKRVLATGTTATVAGWY